MLRRCGPGVTGAMVAVCLVVAGCSSGDHESGKASAAATSTPSASASFPQPTSQRQYLMEQADLDGRTLGAPLLGTAGVGPKTLPVPAASQGVWAALSCAYGPHFAVSFAAGGGYSTGCQQPGNMASAHVPARQMGRRVTVKIPVGVRWWLTAMPGKGWPAERCPSGRIEA